MKTGTSINAHKALVIPIVLGLMWFYDNWSTEAFIYLSLHGAYSVLWLIKQSVYPDKRFEQQQPIWIGVLFVFLPLTGYYVAPYILISRHVTMPPYLAGLVLAIYVLGIFLHYVSDAQKYYTLKYHAGLIEDGLFAHTRNPNYLGEIMMYFALALMAQHWLPFVIWAGWAFGFFVKNMRDKDASMAKFPRFAAYRARTNQLLPRLF